MSQVAGRTASLYGLVERVQALASIVAVWARRAGLIALLAGAVAWLTLLGRWAFDSPALFLLTAVGAVVLALPGLMLVNFAAAVRSTIDTSSTVLADVRDLALESGQEVTSSIKQTMSRPGAGRMSALLGALWQLNGYRSDFSGIVNRLVGSARLLSPLYLLWVAAGLVGAVLVVLVAAVGILIWLV